MLPVRHVLHDQVPVRAAASLERRFSAFDAAGEGGQVQARAGRRFRDKLLSSTDAVGKLASIPVVVQVVNAVEQDAGRAQARWRACSGVHKERVLPEYASATFRTPRAAEGRFPGRGRQAHAGQGRDLFAPATSTTTSPASATTCSTILAAQRDSGGARREGGLLRHAQARAGRSRAVARAEGRQHSAARAAGAGRLRAYSRRCLPAR